MASARLLRMSATFMMTSPTQKGDNVHDNLNVLQVQDAASSFLRSSTCDPMRVCYNPLRPAIPAAFEEYPMPSLRLVMSFTVLFITTALGIAQSPRLEFRRMIAHS